MDRIRLLVPGNIHHHSGGNIYNARLVQGLKMLGAAVDVVSVEGSWPYASAHARRWLGSLLGAWEQVSEAKSENAVTLVDGLIAMGAPDEMEFAAKAGRKTWVLVHMPAPEHHELEARSLRAASGVVCTSTWARKVLEERHGLHGLEVALPGTDPAPLAQGSIPPHLLTVAALLPNKDQLLTVSALAMLQDLDWTASLAGSDQADGDYAQRVRAAVSMHGLDGRILFTGELTGEALENEWRRADLSLLVSRAEAFGMVVTESLTHGIPVVVRDGTGAVEALRLGTGGKDDDGGTLPGAKVAFPADDDPANPALLAQALRRWLEDAGTRDAWRARALDARSRLPGWEQPAARVLAALRQVH
jgi:glycosyltransferase involved in cell wall biosynthesis